MMRIAPSASASFVKKKKQELLLDLNWFRLARTTRKQFIGSYLSGMV